MDKCRWCGNPDIIEEYCTEICKLQSEADDLRDQVSTLMGDNVELNAEIDSLKEQVDRWQDEFCKMCEIRDHLVTKLSAMGSNY